MTTYNISVTTTWTQIALPTDTELLATWSIPASVEVAGTTANTAPTVEGHQLTRDDQITRSVIGQGYIWAKLRPGTVPAAINMIVSK